jgi:membrane protein
MAARRPGRQWRSAAAAVVAGIRRRLVGRDVALIAAGLTFYAGIAVVPVLVLAFALTAWLTSDATVRRLGAQLAGLLPPDLGAPAAVGRLVAAGLGLSVPGALLTLLPISLYGEGLRRALLRFSDRRETLTGWRGRLAALPLLLLTPVLLYPLLLAVGVMADLARTGGTAATLGRIALGFYSVLAALLVPLAWGFRVVGAARVRPAALAVGAFLTAASVSGFLQGFVLFLALPLDLGAPFGGLTVVGGIVALGLWLFLLHLVVICGWLLTLAVDDVLAGRAPPDQPTGGTTGSVGVVPGSVGVVGPPGSTPGSGSGRGSVGVDGSGEGAPEEGGAGAGGT